MQENPSVDNITNAKIDQVAEILASDVGGHALADVQMSTVSPGSLALALDEKGSLYKLGVEQGSKTVYVSPVSLPKTLSTPPQLASLQKSRELGVGPGGFFLEACSS